MESQFSRWSEVDLRHKQGYLGGDWGVMSSGVTSNSPFIFPTGPTAVPAYVRRRRLPGEQRSALSVCGGVERRLVDQGHHQACSPPWFPWFLRHTPKAGSERHLTYTEIPTRLVPRAFHLRSYTENPPRLGAKGILPIHRESRPIGGVLGAPRRRFGRS